MNTAARLECQPVGSDPQRAIEVINRMWCPQGQDIWATKKGTAQSVQSKEIKDNQGAKGRDTNHKPQFFAQFMKLS